MTYLGGGARLHNRVGLVNCSGSYNETTISTALWIGCINVVFPHTFFSKINYFCPSHHCLRVRPRSMEDGLAIVRLIPCMINLIGLIEVSPLVISV